METGFSDEFYLSRQSLKKYTGVSPGALFQGQDEGRLRDRAADAGSFLYPQKENTLNGTAAPFNSRVFHFSFINPFC